MTNGTVVAHEDGSLAMRYATFLTTTGLITSGFGVAKCYCKNDNKESANDVFHEWFKSNK
ncbi:MAG: hypothetical protein GX860_07735 [Alcaligenaceae bacterium]|nr:hypothetical protein [Alcaligenaceae bacterium]